MFERLERINKANDIKNINPEEYGLLAEEIRRFLLKNVSHTGGHLASNLGVVELTIALHLCLDFPDDKLIWDVGHQTYTHKILTGRREQLMTLRHTDGISGFPKKREDPSDTFDTGHSSTSISAALGFAHARELKKEDYKVFSVIGDGALSGGMAYEALNNAVALKSNLVIVLNDNKMSISENVGGMANYLGKIRTNNRYLNLKDDVEQTLLKIPGGNSLVQKIRRSKDSLKRLVIPGMLFEDMGLTYIGPVNGHDIEELVTAFHSAMKMEEAVIVHVKTRKGKGYRLAEKDPLTFHGVDPFYLKTGELRTPSNKESYTKVFSDVLVKLGREDEAITAICAAMPHGTGMVDFAKEFPERFFDVGIAEEHAVTFAAGLAAAGLKPVFAVYSSFLQRAYDQILHDVCIGGYPVVFAIDRGGVVGKDGETHQGIYDISFLSSIPRMTVIAPKNKWEFIEMLRYCFTCNRPIAIRYPRGAVYEGLEEFQEPIRYGKCEILYKENDVLLLCVGSMVRTGDEVRRILKRKKRSVTLVNMRFIHPFDTEALTQLIKTHDTIVTMEENVKTGGFGQQVAYFMEEKGWHGKRFIPIALPDQFIEHGSTYQIKEKYGLHARAIVDQIEKAAVVPAKKERLDLLLVKKGLAPSREKAKAIIMTGNVFVDGKREDKAGTVFQETSLVEIKGNAMRYVSRGGYKLEKAIGRWNIELKDAVCMDVGASTGGFTDCMLQNGAGKVFAVDVGTNQLAWNLRNDGRVSVMEKTNIRYVKREDVGELVDFVTVDVSFISLTKVLLTIRDLMKNGAGLVCLIKPQFEAGKEKVGKKGVVRDPSIHVEVLKRVMDHAIGLGYQVMELDYSPIKGPEGNIEYLLYMKKEIDLDNRENNSGNREAGYKKTIDEVVKHAWEDLS